MSLLGFNKETLSANVLATLIKKFQDMYGQYEQVVLTEIPFISMLSSEDQQSLCSHAESATYESDEVIIKCGDIPDYAYIIMDGDVMQRQDKVNEVEEISKEEKTAKSKKSILVISSQHSVLESYFVKRQD